MLMYIYIYDVFCSNKYSSNSMYLVWETSELINEYKCDYKYYNEAFQW